MVGRRGEGRALRALPATFFASVDRDQRCVAGGPSTDASCGRRDSPVLGPFPRRGRNDSDGAHVARRRDPVDCGPPRSCRSLPSHRPQRRRARIDAATLVSSVAQEAEPITARSGIGAETRSVAATPAFGHKRSQPAVPQSGRGCRRPCVAFRGGLLLGRLELQPSERRFRGRRMSHGRRTLTSRARRSRPDHCAAIRSSACNSPIALRPEVAMR